MCTLSGSVETHHIAVMIVTARHSQKNFACGAVARTLDANSETSSSAGGFAPAAPLPGRACDRAPAAGTLPKTENRRH